MKKWQIMELYNSDELGFSLKCFSQTGDTLIDVETYRLHFNIKQGKFKLNVSMELLIYILSLKV
jgi:hypothetical protein